MAFQEIDSMETAFEMYEKLEDFLEEMTIQRDIEAAEASGWLGTEESESFLKSIENGDTIH